MKKVVLLTTGGTIASKPNDDSGKLASGCLQGKRLASMCHLPNYIELLFNQCFKSREFILF